ncbi:MFS transporter [Pseudoalteromonas spongiae]|uniref:MFS transporter n=1 Tax=Pseudoalteromonas spongiae TaxID=298657 RepID=UPI000C2D046C|nr:MFS transporter [Pseudoalteromonas spongiae]
MKFISKQAVPVALVFIFNGLLFGAWASRVPFIKESFGFSEMQLSALLLLLAFGAISSFAVAGSMADKVGASKLSFWLCILYPFPFALISLSENILLLAISLFLFGWVHGAMDVSMNSWGTSIEKQSKKILMPFFHAMFSFGAGLGAASGVLAATYHTALFTHFIIVSFLVIPICWWLRKHKHLSAVDGVNKVKKASFSFPKGSLLVVAMVAFSCALGEGAMADWASIYMSSEINSSHAQAALAYTVFSIFMVLTRLSGHKIIEILGIVNTVRLCSISSMLGALLLVVINNTYVSLFSFSLLGIGYAILMPLAFSKAAKINENNAGAAIASIAMFAYGGMLLGPVLIGVLAEFLSLKTAFYTFVITSIFVLICSNYFKEEHEVA